MTTPTEPTAPSRAFAFTQFAKTRPILRQLAELTYKSWEDCFEKRSKPPWFFESIEGELKQSSVHWSRPPCPAAEIDELKRKLVDASLPMDERRHFQEEILRIHQEYRASIDAGIAKKISDLKSAAESEIQAFEKWIAEDPEGIAAAAQDKAYDDFLEAEAIRKREEREAEAAAREEENHQMGIAALEDSIGWRLLQLDTSHPDVDGAAITEFLDWCRQSVREVSTLNAFLVGPPRLGKTRALAAAILDTANSDSCESVAWITGSDFSELISDLGSNERREDSNFRLRELATIPYLFFDDLGASGFTAQRTARFFSLIDARYREGRPTYLSSNFSPTQLKRLFTTTSDNRDEAVRILGRIFGTQNEPLAKIFNFKRPTKTTATT